MKVKDLKDTKLKVMNDNIAFQWLKPCSNKGILIIPDTVMNPKLDAGRFFVGKAISVGKKVVDVKPDNYFVFNEYGLASFSKFISEDEIHFIREKEVKVIIDESMKGFVLRELSDGARKEMDGGIDAGSDESIPGDER